MQRLLRALVAIALLSAMPVWAENRAGLVTMEFDLSGQPAGETVQLWIPYPVSNQDQLISKIRLQGDYAETGVYTVTGNGTPLLYAEWPRDSKSRTLTLAFEVARDELQRGNLPTREPSWNSNDYDEYLVSRAVNSSLQISALLAPDCVTVPRIKPR